MPTDFIVHDKADTVGVAVVEDIQPNKELTGWIMETDETIRVKALDTVPLGHKIALADIKNGDTVLKHGHDVGPWPTFRRAATCTCTISRPKGGDVGRCDFYGPARKRARRRS